MDEKDDLERRVGALEETVQDLSQRVRRSEQDAAAARILAGGADRDVGEVRGEMREFRGEVRAEFDDVRTEMRAEFADVRTEMRAEFADVRTEMRAGFADVRAEMRAGFAAVRAEAAAFRVETGAEFADVRAEAAAFRGEFDDFRSEMRDFRTQNNRVLNAMREDITGLREHVDRGFLAIRGRLDATAAGQQTIVGLLSTLIAREERGPQG